MQPVSTFGFLVFAIVLALMACAPRPMDGSEKFSDELRQTLAKNEHSNSRYAVFIRVTDDGGRAIEQIDGLTVETWAGDVAVALATEEAIRQAAELDEVVHISISGTVELLDRTTRDAPR